MHLANLCIVCFPSPPHRVFDFSLFHQPLALLLLLVLLFWLAVLFAVFASLCIAYFPDPLCSDVTLIGSRDPPPRLEIFHV